MDANVISNNVVEVQGADSDFFLVNESKYFTIDDATRKITPPKDFTYLGVESDSNSKRIWFECPRFVGDNLDLTELNVYINYQNANGDKDRWHAEDVTIDGDKIHFSWKLSRKVLKYKGTVKFIVCALETDAEGEKDPEWNTTLCQGTVLEGLEVENPEPDTPEYDIVNQLLKNIPLYTDEKILAQQEIVTTGNPRTCSIDFYDGVELHDGDAVSVEINNNGLVAETKIEISSDGPYLYTGRGEVMSVAFGPLSMDASQVTCSSGSSSKVGAVAKFYLDTNIAKEMLGKTVQILNPSPKAGEVKSVSATICGVAPDDFMVYFDPSSMPQEMPFEVNVVDSSKGESMLVTIDSKYGINGYAINKITHSGVELLADSLYSDATIKVYTGGVRKLDEIFIPDTIARMSDISIVQKNIEKVEKKAVNPDYNQNDPTQPDYIKNRPFYGGEQLLAQQDIVASGNPLACHIDFYEGVEVHDGDEVSVEINNNGKAVLEKLTINPAITYLFGVTMSAIFGPLSMNASQATCSSGNSSNVGAAAKLYLDTNIAKEMLGKTVQILNPSPNTGEVKSVSATICGVAPDDFMVYFDPRTMPQEMPFDTSDGFIATVDSKYFINGFVIDRLTPDGITVLTDSDYSGATIKISTDGGMLKTLNEQFIPNAISRKKDLDALFGRCIVTEILSGLTSGMNISLEYPLNFSAWSVWLADKKISGDLKPDEVFVSASELFGSEDITVKITAEKFVVVTTAMFVNRHKKLSWGTLQFVEIENI